jgi:putative ABC transport system permease protein
MGSWIQEIRHALRGLGRSPGFTGVAVATLALGIGATVSIFSVTDAVILRPLPFPEAERLVMLHGTDLSVDDEQKNVSGADFLDWSGTSTSFEEMAAYRNSDINLIGSGFPQRVSGASVPPNFFRLIGADAALGRLFSPEIDTPGAGRTVVVSYGLWRSQFGGNSEILGQSLKLNNEHWTVVGVLSAGFEFPRQSQLWTAARYRVPDPPFDFEKDPSLDRGGGYLGVMGRLKDGVGLRSAQAEMSALAERLATEYPATNTDKGIALVPLLRDMTGDARPLLYVLLGAVGFVLLIACANVANLLLVRASRRQREMAIRLALGAGRSRIVRQLLTESVLLALGGGFLGLLLALWGTDALLALAPEGIPRLEDTGANLRVLGFTSLVVLGTGLLSGLAPVPQVFGQNLQAATKEGGRGSTAIGPRSRLRKALIVGQVALSLILLVGAGLMMRTFLKLISVDPGFDPANTIVAHLTLPESKYEEEHEVTSFYRRVLEGLEALPGVTSYGAALTLPMHWNIRGTLAFNIEGRVSKPSERPVAVYQIVSPGYFSTLRVPLVRGRLLTEADREDAPPVALVNETFARQFWPGEDPIGRRITWNNPPGEDAEWVSVVGVVRDTTLEGLDRPPVPESYRPYPQAVLPYTTLVVRSSSDPAALQAAVRRVVAGIDPEQPLHGVTTMETVLADSLAIRRFTLLLFGVFAGAALILAAVGLYGVLSFSVSQRSHEFGIRRALGAQTGEMIFQVLLEGFWLISTGLGIGTLGGLALRRFISSQVHGVSVLDPASYILGISLLATIALVACSAPAVRASRIDPAIALRDE